MGHKKEVRKRKRRFLALLLIVIALTSLAIVLSVPTERTEIRKYDIYLTVGNYTGFNVGTDALYFGTMMPGTNSTRSINVINDNNGSLSLSIRVEGNVTNFISVMENAFIPANESYMVGVSANVPLDSEFGNYMGKLVMLFKAG